jgi:uncharacterized protein YbjT (DUF2867 family)
MARCAVLGGTGFVGRNLVRRLRADGHEVRCLVRDLGAAAALADTGAVLVAGNVLDERRVCAALRGSTVVFYLVHSLGSADFAGRDRLAASIVARAAAAEGVRQLVYLGGIVPDRAALSGHLASRTEVGEMFLRGATPALVLRAAMIIGNGSASFEVLRHIVHRTPLVPAPCWPDARIQPIAIEDVVHHLAASVCLPWPVNVAADIGGPEVVTYSELVQRYARVAGLPRRFLVPAPAKLAPLAALAVGALTPVPAPVVAPLLGSLGYDMICRSPPSPTPPPPHGPTGLDAAMGRQHPDAAPEEDNLEVRDERVVEVAVPAERLWQVILSVGGARGWFVPRPVLAAVGLLDHLIGGVGLHRGRPAELAAGDSVDWWRVVDCDHAGRRLVLEAELRLPGRLWLELVALPGGPGATTYRQTLTFAPHGLLGRAFWLTQRPLRSFLLSSAVRNVVSTTRKESAQ